MPQESNIDPFIICIEAIFGSEGGFATRLSAATGNVTGHFFYGQDHFRALFDETMNTETLDQLASVLLPVSHHEAVTIESEDLTKNTLRLVKQADALPIGKIAQVPSQWYTCFFTVTMSPRSPGGMLGYLDDRGQAHILFFYSKKEGRRILIMQRNLRADGLAQFIRMINDSPMPEQSTKPTTELLGMMAAVLCVGEALHRGDTHFKLVPKTEH